MDFGKDMNILTDPWYNGNAFDNGWSLLYENKHKFIIKVLNKTNYIYITHEHPDHFSIKFFKEYSQILKNKKIKIIFQKTIDKRVENFIKKKLNLNLIILENFKTIKLKKFKLTLINSGPIDSSLIVETDKYYHVNFNDCEFSESELKKIKKLLKNKKKIIIYMQFSYAAFRSNDIWLKKAALFKLENILKIYNCLGASLVIPFASFVYFSSKENFHLNNHMNNVTITTKHLKKNNINNCFLNPKLKEVSVDKLINDESVRYKITKKSMLFWDCKFKNIKPKNISIHNYQITDDLIKNFLMRIKLYNSFFLLFLIRYLSFKYFFGDIIIYLKDTKKTFKINFFKIEEKKIEKSKIDLEMNSNRLVFLLNELYGFDTLTVNGCFFEVKKNGFERLIRSIGFIKINQAGNGIKIKNILSFNLINHIISLFLKLKSKKT